MTDQHTSTTRTSDPVLALLGPNDPDDYFAKQQHRLGAQTWRAPAEADAAAWAAGAREAIDSVGGGRPVHLIASSTTAAPAIQLVAEIGQGATSLQLVDPDIDTQDTALRDAMRQVNTPTLVVVAAPDRSTTFAKAQTIAGGVPNGVMVIIDDQEPPAHQTSAEAFNEWVSAFMQIAEGLFGFRVQPHEGVMQ